MRKFFILLILPFLLTACSEVELGSAMYKKYNRPTETVQNTSKGAFKVGKPYNVQGKTYYPQETYDYVETGVASWYGPGFHSKKTASGEMYDQNELTAAHRTLQMPSLVRVTNLDNGRSVVVRVNDRGPFAHGRIIDVSAKAAELLGMVRTGTARVKLELLANESRTLAHHARNGKSTKGAEIAYNNTGSLSSKYAAPSGPVVSDMPSSEQDLLVAARQENIRGHYHGGNFYPNPTVEKSPVSPTQIYVQAGSFSQLSNARRLSEKLGVIANPNIETADYAGRTLYKVKLGPMSNVQEADNILRRVLASGQSDARIIVQ